MENGEGIKAWKRFSDKRKEKQEGIKSRLY